MSRSTDLDKIKCGQIFILSNNKFSLVCEFCKNDYYALGLEFFVAHINEHFPETPANIKAEDSIDICASESGEYKPNQEDTQEENWSEVQVSDSIDICASESGEYKPIQEDIQEENWSDVQANNSRFRFSVLENDTDSQSIKPYSRESYPCNQKSVVSDQTHEDRKVITAGPKVNLAFSQRCPSSLRIKIIDDTTIALCEEHQENSNGKKRTTPTKIIDSLTPSVSKKSHGSSASTRSKFVCRICFKMFDVKCELDRHEDAHSGKRYQCQLCLKYFSRRDNLRRHVKTIHLKDLIGV